MLQAFQICKSFPESPGVLDQISLSVEEGEFLTLLGPSGCGKTTFLRCLSGLETPDSGELLFKGQSLLKQTAQERPFHLVFQKSALFPHMTVFENIEFSLKIKKMETSKRKARIQELLELIQLPGYAERLPASLSGGQSQRVALARALADHPQILLLDEPFSALDEKLRLQLRAELKSLQKKLGLTFIFVTHDQQEAFQLSDRIALFSKGRIEQVGTPQELFFHPQSSFVAEFLGQKNQVQKNAKSAFYILPEKIMLNHQGEVQMQGRLELLSLAGPFCELRIQDSAGKNWVLFSPHELALQLKVGTTIPFSFNQSELMEVPLSGAFE